MSKILKYFNMDHCLQSLVLLFAGFSVALCEMRTTNMKENIGQKDRILFDGSLSRFETRSQINCANQCSMMERCMSMFYESDKNQWCVLHEFLGGYLQLHPSITRLSPDSKYFEKQEGPSVFTRSGKCLSNGFEYDPVVDTCYTIQTMDIDFDLNNQYCADLNSELIKIASQEKQDWITSIISTNTEEWICIQGNNDNKVHYQFDDGTRLTYFNWDSPSGQPDGGAQHYLLMQKSADYKWHDAPTYLSGLQCVIVCEK